MIIFDDIVNANVTNADSVEVQRDMAKKILDLTDWVRKEVDLAVNATKISSKEIDSCNSSIIVLKNKSEDIVENNKKVVLTINRFIENINNVKKIAESTNPPKIDEWDKNVPAENIDGMGTIESEFSNKNHILTEQRIENLEKLIIKDGIELNIKKILQKLLNENLNVKEYNEYLDIIERLLNIKNK